MYGWIKPQVKDPTRIVGGLERELIYYRDEKECQVCGAKVAWADHEVHHVEGYAKGGPTDLDNGALVHRHCHPKGSKAVADFADMWKKKLVTR
jgi:5-methylcytosine-specific restriction endonuclease McrA